MMKKNWLIFLAVFAVLSSVSVAAFAEDAGISVSAKANVGTSVSGTVPMQICEYAAPPQGCDYVAGPNYDAKTQCGLVLKCDSDSSFGIDVHPIEATPPSGKSILTVPPTISTEASGSAKMTTSVSSSGTCPSQYVMSEDEKTCLKVSAFSAPMQMSSSFSGTVEGELSTKGETSGSVSTNEQGRVSLKATDGQCPQGYMLAGGSDECVKPPVPTLILSPNAAAHAVVFSSSSIEVQDSDTKESVSIAPSAGFKVIVNDASPIAVEKTSDKMTFVTRNKVSASVSPSVSVEVKEGKVLVSGAELKVMPDAAVAAAETTLKAKAESVELADTQEGATYRVKSATQARVFGIFPVSVSVTANVNAKTGSVESVQKPWWGFIAW